MKPKLNLIVAIDNNRAIGYKNNLLFNNTEDLRLFYGHTNGKTVVMGRNTYNSIGGPLDNRENIVLSADTLSRTDVITCHDMNSVFDVIAGKDTFIIGGAKVYEQFLPYVDSLYISLFEKTAPYADTYFPDFDVRNDFELDYHNVYKDFIFFKFDRK